MKARAASAIGPVLAVAAMPTAVGSATGRPVHPPRATGAIAHGTPAGAMPFVVALVAHGRAPGQGLQCGATDRKSTSLNSSHANISYAVFCLKKKKKNHTDTKKKKRETTKM